IKPTSSGDTPFRTKVDVFILTPPLLQYENIINGNLVFSNTLNEKFIQHNCKFVIQVGDLVNDEAKGDHRNLTLNGKPGCCDRFRVAYPQ
ncbi:MAG: hypothetical protein PHI97_14075, partial [Desulfobulbus sp.]|nr:hypothetical protein [Desulfobulbus sp.]